MVSGERPALHLQLQQERVDRVGQGGVGRARHPRLRRRSRAGPPPRPAPRRPPPLAGQHGGQLGGARLRRPARWPRPRSGRPPTRLPTTTCASAKAATCAQVGDAQHLVEAGQRRAAARRAPWRAGRRSRHRPRRRPAAASRRRRPARPSSASDSRLASPPDAMRPSGRAGSPGFGCEGEGDPIGARGHQPPPPPPPRRRRRPAARAAAAPHSRAVASSLGGLAPLAAAGSRRPRPAPARWRPRRRAAARASPSWFSSRSSSAGGALAEADHRLQRLPVLAPQVVEERQPLLGGRPGGRVELDAARPRRPRRAPAPPPRPPGGRARSASVAKRSSCCAAACARPRRAVASASPPAGLVAQRRPTASAAERAIASAWVAPRSCASSAASSPGARRRRRDLVDLVAQQLHAARQLVLVGRAALPPAATVARQARCAAPTAATRHPAHRNHPAAPAGAPASRRCWSCCPWISPSRAPSEARPPTVTLRSLTRAIERPSAPTSRRMMAIPSPAASTSAIGSSSSEATAVKMASTRAASVPDADLVGGGARAERQRQRVDHERLARAGLAGQHGEAGADRQPDATR